MGALAVPCAVRLSPGQRQPAKSGLQDWRIDEQQNGHSIRGVAEELAKKDPTSWIRNWLLMPLLAARLVGIFFAALLCWLFAGAVCYGGPVHHVSATAIKVGTYAKRKGGDQSATLRLASVEKETCLDNLYSPSTMRKGQLLDVGISMFPFGLLILSIASADPALTAVHQD